MNKPKGATHYHYGDEEWADHFIKVENANQDNEVVLVWVDTHKNKGFWSDLPVWAKDDKENYVKVEDI